MAMDEFPGIIFAAEELGYPQIEGDGLCSAAQVGRGALETNQVGQTIARGHVQNLKPTLPTALEACGVTFVSGPDGFGSLLKAPPWPEERGRRLARGNLAKWGRIPIYIGARRLLTLLHKLLKIMLVIIH